MKLIVTADLHYDVARSSDPARRIAEEICGLRADALLLVGDAAGRDLGIVSECLHLFDGFAGRKFFVAGNHDIWAHPGEDSLDKLHRALPEICRKADFHPLDIEPASIDGVGLVGSIGWYDFSFRPMHLGIPLRFYSEKIAPGAAARMDRYSHLVADRTDVPESAMSMGTRWMDGEHVRMAMSDTEFCRMLLERLDQHLQQAARHCDKIIVGLHHLPFRELVPTSEDPSWAFAQAYMGSELFGELLLAHPKVRYVFCGHSHRAGSVRHQHLECINVGCTYTEKRYDVIEL